MCRQMNVSYYMPNFLECKIYLRVNMSCCCATGIGYDLLVDMLKCIGPTHVVKINISSRSKNLPAGAFWLEDDDAASINLIEISSARKDSYNRS